jgi:hypothetical protein
VMAATTIAAITAAPRPGVMPGRGPRSGRA